MKKSKIKICGISNLDVLKELINLNINYVGFIFYSKSPRFADSDFLESFKDIDFKNTKPVCVYVNPDEEYVYKTSSYFSNPILQFHGDESNDFCESFGLEYWKAIRVKEKSDVLKTKLYSSASAILFENHKEGIYGGTGESFDWNWLNDLQEKEQYFILSGGINSENVHNALSTNSWCIDLNSGVESEEGIKDIALIKNILKIINTYGS
jgi:phosphoribosylanthranilate isomerase|tara:strand:+ start:1001 stop:1627 length:627 start_codon:yes stop_codon:yes gene_type:complete